MIAEKLLEHFGSKLQFELILPQDEIDKHPNAPGTKPRRLYGTLAQFQAQFEAMNKRGWGVYFTVNESSDINERKAAFMERARAVWCEDDGEDKGGRTDPSTFPLEPSAIVESSPGKFHYYWFTSTENLDEWQQVMDGIAEQYGGDKGAKLKTQVLRVPGFANTKYESNPLVALCGGNFKRYDWYDITQAFPMVEPTEPTERGYEGSDFDYHEAQRDLITGEAIYPSTVSLAASMVNRGVPRQEIYENLTGLLKLVPDDCKDRAKIAQSKLGKTIDSAYAKFTVKRAKIKYEQDKVGPIHTVLDWPPGRMGELARWIESTMPYPSKEIAIATAFTLGSIGCACYHYQGLTVSRARTILAPNGRGKESASKAISRLLNVIPVPIVEKLIMKEAHSPFNYQADMNNFAVRMMINSEAGLILGTGSGDQTSKLAWKLDALSKNIGGGTLSVVEGSRRNQQPAEKALPIHNPIFVLLDESTPETYLPAAEKSLHQQSGQLARTELFFIGPEEGFNRLHHANTEPPWELVELFTCLFSQLQESKVGTRPFEYAGDDDFIQADFSKVEEELTLLHEMDIKARQASHDNPLERALVVRYMEKVHATAMILAALDCCDMNSSKPKAPVIRKEHLQYACDYHNEQARSIKANATHGDMAGVMEKAMNKLYEFLMRVTEGQESESDLSRLEDGNVTTMWISRKFRPNDRIMTEMCKAYRTNPPGARRMIIEEAIGSGMLVPVTGKKNQWVITV